MSDDAMRPTTPELNLTVSKSAFGTKRTNATAGGYVGF